MNSSKSNSTKVSVYKIKFKIGDTVIIRAGKYKNKTGVIKKVHPMLDRKSVV